MNDSIPYARLSRRLKALQIDWIFPIILYWLFVVLVSEFNIKLPERVLWGVLVGIIFSNPLLVSLTGATVGQHFCGLRVRRVLQDKPLNLLLSTLRFLISIPLVFIPWWFIFTTKKYQILHDFICNSIVVLKRPETLPAYEALAEREQDKSYTYPSFFRRILFIVLYLGLTLLSILILFNLIFSEACLSQRSCTSIELLPRDY